MREFRQVGPAEARNWQHRAALGLRIGAPGAPDECQRKSLPVVSVGHTMGERWLGPRITRAADPRSDAAVPREVLKRCAGGWDQSFSMSA
jgi:hypothetical protein